MGLIEDAENVYAKEQLEDKKQTEIENRKFIKDAIDSIKDKFGENLNIDVIEDKESGVAFMVDGLKMIVRKSQGYYSIYLVQKCPKCGTEYENIIVSLKTLGKALKTGHVPYECDKILKDREPVKELTTEEKLIETLRDFIHENLSE
jgi:hypothetical protein